MGLEKLKIKNARENGINSDEISELEDLVKRCKDIKEGINDIKRRLIKENNVTTIEISVVEKMLKDYERSFSKFLSSYYIEGITDSLIYTKGLDYYTNLKMCEEVCEMTDFIELINSVEGYFVVQFALSNLCPEFFHIENEIERFFYEGGVIESNRIKDLERRFNSHLDFYKENENIKAFKKNTQSKFVASVIKKCDSISQKAQEFFSEIKTNGYDVDKLKNHFVQE